MERAILTSRISPEPEPDGRDERGRFTAGAGNKGKPPGARARFPTPKHLREELAATMAKLGDNNKGRGGTGGFLRAIGRKEPMAILNAAVKLESAKTVATALKLAEPVVRYDSPEEFAAEIDRRIGAGYACYLTDKYLRPLAEGRPAPLIDGTVLADGSVIFDGEPLRPPKTAAQYLASQHKPNGSGNGFAGDDCANDPSIDLPPSGNGRADVTR